jgi:EAL domain-containing protein (putative c-di-GMP-specific phosphodiesterase class I)
VVRSCIDLAHRLNLKVVAEGVESRDDWDFLVRTGAQEAQGYLIARPMPAARVPAWANEWSLTGGPSTIAHAS